MGVTEGKDNGRIAVAVRPAPVTETHRLFNVLMGRIIKVWRKSGGIYPKDWCAFGLPVRLPYIRIEAQSKRASVKVNTPTCRRTGGLLSLLFAAVGEDFGGGFADR